MRNTLLPAAGQIQVGLGVIHGHKIAGDDQQIFNDIGMLADDDGLTPIDITLVKLDQGFIFEQEGAVG